MHHWICMTVLPKVSVFRLLGQFWAGSRWQAGLGGGSLAVPSLRWVCQRPDCERDLPGRRRLHLLCLARRLLSQQKGPCLLPRPWPQGELSSLPFPCGHRKWYYIRNRFATLFLLIIATPTIIRDRCNIYDSCFYYFSATVCMCFPFNYSIWI